MAGLYEVIDHDTGKEIKRKPRLYLHPGQTRAWDSQRRLIFMLAGTQGGKTSLLPWWLNREIQRCGAGDYIAVTSSYDLFKLKFLPEMRTVFEHILGIGRYWAGERIIEIKNFKTGQFDAKRADDPMWARIILRSAATKGGLESATAKAAILDEVGQDEFTLDDWQAVLRRLSLHQGRVFAGTTIYNLGWLKTEIYDAWADGDSDIDIIQFASTANPLFPQAEFDRAKRTMQDWRFQMFYLGQFARPIGLIYGAFTDEMLVDPFSIPADWERVVGIDFGGANTATLSLAADPKSGIWYAYRESLEGGKTTQEHVDGIHEYPLGDDTQFVGGATGESQERRDWGAAGLSVIEPPVSGVETGIDRAMTLIKQDEFRVFRTLSGLRDELGGYRRKTDSSGNVTDEIVDKRKYHRLDALRYAATLITEGHDVTFGWG